MENMNWQIPLWKMKITAEQYAGLKTELYDAFIHQNQHIIKSLAKESALFYAEWWNREYSGGSPSREAVAHTLKLSSNHSNELYELAKAGGKKLNISVIVKQNRLWFRSLLIQGGLPMHHIHSNKDNIIVYKNFLIGLIRHTKSININWNDCSFIENLPCTNYLPTSFKNEGIYELSLLIARAINEENDELLPYDAREGNWSTLTTDLKESSRTESLHAVPFILKWRVKKVNINLQLSYHVETAKKISNSYIIEKNLSECGSFSLRVKNQSVATYFRSINGDFVCRDKRFVNFIWEEEPVILLQLTTNTNQIIDVTAPNSFAPDFENPVLLVEADGYWEIKSGTSNSNKNAVIHMEEWKCCSEIEKDPEEVNLCDKNLIWREFLDTISLKHFHTGEDIVFDNTSTPYSCEFAGWTIDWIQNANYKILTSEPDVRLYDESMEKVKVGNIYYREYRAGNWTKYQKKLLPIGLLEFKIELPDKKFAKEKFYYTGSLNCIFDNMTPNSGEIRWEWNNGSIFPMTDQVGIEMTELRNNCWSIHRQANLTNYPDITRFTLIPVPNIKNSPNLEIAVASPFKGVVLLSPQREEIINGKVLCRTSLYGYRYIVMGQKVPTKVFHLQNDKIVISGQLIQGIYSLNRFEDNIREMFLLNGSDPFDVDSMVRVVIGLGGNNKMIEVNEYNVFSRQIVKNGPIVIIDNLEDQNIIDFNAQLYALAVDCPCEEIRVEKLEKRDDGFFLKDGVKLNKFIVFSDKFSEKFTDDQVVPRFFDSSSQTDKNLDSENYSLKPQEINIKNIKASLEEAPAYTEEWKKVIEYYITVLKYSLPFKTMNCFRAIAESPLLMVKMALSLSQSARIIKEDFLFGLSRFEGEFAVAWHWINSEHWDNAMEWFMLDFPSSMIPNLWISLSENRMSLLSFTLNPVSNADLVYLSNKAITVNPIHPPSRLRIQEIRSKLGSNTNFPNNLIIIPDNWTCLFPNAMDCQLPIYIRALLVSPVKAALAMTGMDESLWIEDEIHLKMRRTINFYRQLLPEEYADIFMCMVKQINKKIAK